MNDSQAIFALHKDWKTLDGPVLGLSQQVLVGLVRVQLPQPFDLSALESAMADFLQEAPPPQSAGSAPAQLLVARAIQWAGTVQRRYGVAVSELFGIEPIPGEDQPGLFRIYTPYVVKDAALIALEWAEASLQHFLAHGTLAEADPTVANNVRGQLARSLAPLGSSPNAFRFLRAADRLRIPATPIMTNLVQFGIGRTSRLMIDSYLDTTSIVGAQIADNKAATAMVLRRAGLPAPVHALVADEAQALKAAARIGFPVVVKPSDRSQGLGVAAGLTSEDAVRTAFAEASKHSTNILVERHFDGVDHRLTVFEGKVLQVIERRPGGVTGDGRRTLAELVEIEAALPESRRREREFGRRLLLLDDEALALAGEQGLQADSVVEEGRFIGLRRRANVSSGGTPFSIPLDQIHPDNLELAVRAAAMLRLNMAGVDLITPDISRSWLETGAVICEVNGQPQISQTGSAGIYATILQSMLRGRPSIPVIAYVSAEAPAGLAGLNAPGIAIGTSSTAGVKVNGMSVAAPQRDTFGAARALFAHPAMDAAIVHLAPADILERGLPFPNCAAAIVARDALADSQALAWLEPHVLRDIILPQGAEAAPRHTRPSVRTTYRDDPWSAMSDFVKMFVSGEDRFAAAEAAYTVQ